MEFFREQNLKRIEEQEKQYKYYIGDCDAMTAYLESALQKTYDPEDIQEFQKPILNIVKKAINQLSVVYREPASRKVFVKEKEIEKWTKYYQSILIPDVNTTDNQALRMAKLSNTSLTRISIRKDKISYLVKPSYLFNVEFDAEDPFKITEISYSRDYINENGAIQEWVVFWTDELYYRRQLLEVRLSTTVGGEQKRVFVYGDAQPMPDMSGMLNPYKIIPYANLTLEMYNDLWGQGRTDLVNINEQINVLLVNIINEQIIHGGGGAVLAVNTHLAEKRDNSDAVYMNQKVRVGRRHPIVVEGVRADEKDPKLEYVNFDPQITEIRETIDWAIKTAALTQGLNPNSFLAEVQATSGYSKVIDSLEQLELRKDDLEPCRSFEDRRFEVTRAINNYYATTQEGIRGGFKTIPEDTYLQVDFAEIEAPKTVDEQIKIDDWKLAKNLISVVDLAKQQNPDMDDEAIKGDLAENKKINDEFMTRPPINNEDNKNRDMNKDMKPPDRSQE